MERRKKTLTNYYVLVFPPLFLGLIVLKLLDNTLWNHVLSPTKSMYLRMRHQGGGALIEKVVTYSELSELFNSMD